MTEIMTEPLVSITVLQSGMEHGGTTTAATQTSMDCTSVDRVTPLVSRGIASMPLLQVGLHFDIQT